MSGDPPVHRPALTEETPATPSWVESELDEMLASLPARPSIATLRVAYLDCLAASAGPADAEAAHDRCRTRFLDGLREDGVGAGAIEALGHKLAALEAELTSRT